MFFKNSEVWPTFFTYVIFYWILCDIESSLWNTEGLNEKKMKFSHDSKITVQVFNTLSSKFPQIITNLTEDTELAFTERLERLYLIINLLIVLLSHILNKSNSNFVFEFSWNFCPIPIFIFPLEVLSYAINYLIKVAFSKLLFS